MSNPETHACECGFIWKHGHSGSHQCSPYYRARIAELTAAQPIASVPAQPNQAQQSNVMPPAAAPVNQHVFDDEAIERAAMKHVAVSWPLLADAQRARGERVDYRKTEQFARLKAFAEELASGFRGGRNTSPNGAAGAPAGTTEAQGERVAVKVERNRIRIVRGFQSFMLAYEGDTDEELQWYAGQLRAVLSSITPCVKTDISTEAQELPPLPAMVYLGGDEAFGDAVYGYTADQVREAQRVAIAAMAAPATKQGGA